MRRGTWDVGRDGFMPSCPTSHVSRPIGKSGEVLQQPLVENMTKMEKNRKKWPISWTKCHIMAILFLTFSGNLCLGQANDLKVMPPDSDVKSGESLELREAKVARESAENRVLELELEKKRLSADYARLRSQYADLYIKTYKAINRLRELELSAANLIQSGDGTPKAAQNSNSNDSIEGTGHEVLEALELILAKQVELQDALREFSACLGATMDILQPSEAIKAELDKRLEKLKAAVENSARPLTISGKRDGGALRSCNILSIDEEHGLVLIDKGTIAGMQPGRKLKLPGRDGNPEARLVVVDARAEISAAVMLEGELNALRPGNILQPESGVMTRTEIRK